MNKGYAFPHFDSGSVVPVCCALCVAVEIPNV